MGCISTSIHADNNCSVGISHANGGCSEIYRTGYCKNDKKMKITPIHLSRLQSTTDTQALCDKLNEIAETPDINDIYSALSPDQLKIIRNTENVTGFSFLLMRSKSQAVPLSEAKFIAQHELYAKGYTIYQIADLFGLKYGGVYNGLVRYRELMKRKHFAKKAEEMKKLRM